MMDKTASVLAWIKTVAPNYASCQPIFHNHKLEVKKKPVSLKNVLDKAENSINFY